MKNVLLVKAGEAANAIRLVAGDYDRWFREAFTKTEVPLQLTVVQVYLGEKLPRASDFDAIVMTGSPQSMTQPPEWTVRAGEWLADAGEHGRAVLGVCFGHQLLGHIHGVRVIRNPLGREIGTVEIGLTAEGVHDPLFEGIPARFAIQTTHEDIVSAPPSNAVLLASNAIAQVQAMGIGPNVRGVQFHPELSAEGVGAVIESRQELIERESQARGAAPGDRLRALRGGLRRSSAGVHVLKNFLERFG